jgi:hypothetical protein
VKWRGFDAMGQVLVLLASCAAFDVFRDPCPCAGPEVFLVDFSNRLISTGMSTKWSVMPGVHKFAFQPLIWGNDEAV